jgi:hypothetical protein
MMLSDLHPLIIQSNISNTTPREALSGITFSDLGDSPKIEGFGPLQGTKPKSALRVRVFLLRAAGRKGS